MNVDLFSIWTEKGEKIQGVTAFQERLKGKAII